MCKCELLYRAYGKCSILLIAELLYIVRLSSIVHDNQYGKPERIISGFILIYKSFRVSSYNCFE